MNITIKPTVTMNVGDSGSTASSAITYTAYESIPLNPKLGDFRMKPGYVNMSERATMEWFDPDKNQWMRGEATVYDRALARELAELVDHPGDYVYYCLNINNTGSGSVVEGDSRKPSFAIDNKLGE